LFRTNARRTPAFAHRAQGAERQLI
jgi:hypothetical protein